MEKPGHDARGRLPTQSVAPRPGALGQRGLRYRPPSFETEVVWPALDHQTNSAPAMLRLVTTPNTLPTHLHLPPIPGSGCSFNRSLSYEPILRALLAVTKFTSQTAPGGGTASARTSDTARRNSTVTSTPPQTRNRSSLPSAQYRNNSPDTPPWRITLSTPAGRCSSASTQLLMARRSLPSRNSECTIWSASAQ